MYRENNSLLFMGNGDVSKKAVYRLMRRVRAAFIVLSGVQQPDHPLDPIWADMHAINRKSDLIAIEGLVRDVAMALTGKEIEFK
jgi:hypothetical protein